MTAEHSLNLDLKGDCSEYTRWKKRKSKCQPFAQKLIFSHMCNFSAVLSKLSKLHFLANCETECQVAA